MNTAPDILYTWPLILLIEECCVPESAIHVINAIKDLDTEVCGLTIKFASWEAREKITNN